jgi:hypothetical protein
MIDYGRGLVNIDTETGIRYGVVHMNSLDNAWDRMEQGTNLDFEEYKEHIRNRLARAIDGVLDDEGLDQCNMSADDYAAEIVDSLEFDRYENNGDFVRYELEEDGLNLRTTNRGDLFVIKSPFYTLARFCSPCAPGAGDLYAARDGGVRTYCLPADWWSECPYPIYRCDNNQLTHNPQELSK